jgi:hypothetical protein
MEYDHRALFFAITIGDCPSFPSRISRASSSRVYAP